MTILEIIEELRDLDVPEKALEPIIRFEKELNCCHENVQLPVYSKATWLDKSRLISKAKCKVCKKEFDENDIIVEPEKVILKPYLC